MKKAILYLRYSDPKQNGGTSIETQEQTARSACQIEGFEIVEVDKNEAVSADKDKQTHRVADLLEFCKERQGKFEILMVYKLDRFARGQEQHHWLRGQLLKLGIFLRSATERIDESPSGKLVEGMLAAVNEYDNEIKRERVKLALWKRVDQGLWPWQPPIGYMSVRGKDEKVQPHAIDSSCADAIRDMFLQYSSGIVLKSDLSKMMNKRQIKNYKGKTLVFAKQTINDLLDNVYFIGKLRHQDGRIIDGKHEKLIDESVFMQCQRIQKGLSSTMTSKRHMYSSDFCLRRFVSCEDCGQLLTACWSHATNGKKHPYYYCYNKDCSHFSKMIRRDELEQQFSDFLANVKPTEDFIQRFHKVFIKRYEQRMYEIQGDFLRGVEDLQKLEKEKKWIIDQGKKGILEGNTLRDEIKDVEQRITLLKLGLTESHNEELDVEGLLAYAYDFIRTVEKTWYDATSEYRIKLQRVIFPRGVVFGDSGFSNRQISPLFNLISTLGAEQSVVVTPGEFESPLTE